MSWELLRDIGLIMFVFGCVVFIAVTITRYQNPQRPKASWARSIGDGMMRGGACLAVIAMSIGYLVSNGSP